MADNTAASGEQGTAKSTWWKTVVGHLKDVKEVLAAITAIGVAIALALNHFATSKALDCFKTEARRSNELVQTILQVNDLTATSQIANLRLRQLDSRIRGLQGREESVEYDAAQKDIVQEQSRLEDTTSKLKAARDRRTALDGTIKQCN